jgi:hypothetical protein
VLPTLAPLQARSAPSIAPTHSPVFPSPAPLQPKFVPVLPSEVPLLLAASPFEPTGAPFQSFLSPVSEPLPCLTQIFGMPFKFVVNPNSTLATFQWEVPAGSNGYNSKCAIRSLPDEFSRAVAEWDAGKPDTLTLIVERVPLEPECQAEKGRIKSNSTASPVSIIRHLKRLTKLLSPRTMQWCPQIQSLRWGLWCHQVAWDHCHCCFTALLNCWQYCEDL